MDSGNEATSPQPMRAAVRREVAIQCVVTEQEYYQLVGQDVLDLSPWGMRVLARIPMRPGQRVRATFQAPGKPGRWMQAEGEVARVEVGRRCSDGGYAVGVTFTEIAAADRALLARRLEGLPPIIPRRPLRVQASRTPST